AVAADEQEDAGGPGRLAADLGQVDGERGDVAVSGCVIRPGQGVLAVSDERVVGAGDSGIELVEAAELLAVDEFDAVRRPEASDGRAPGRGIRLAPHGHVAADDVFGGGRDRCCHASMLGSPVTGESSTGRNAQAVRVLTKSQRASKAARAGTSGSGASRSR